MESRKKYIEHKRKIQKELTELRKKLSRHQEHANKNEFDWLEVTDLSHLLYKLKELNQTLSI